MFRGLHTGDVLMTAATGILSQAEQVLTLNPLPPPLYPSPLLFLQTYHTYPSVPLPLYNLSVLYYNVYVGINSGVTNALQPVNLMI